MSEALPTACDMLRTPCDNISGGGVGGVVTIQEDRVGDGHSEVSDNATSDRLSM